MERYSDTLFMMANPTNNKSPFDWNIRPMRLEDIEKCLDIWSKVELAEAHQTVASTLAIDPNGLFVAELTSNGEVIGMVAGPITRPDTAFLGFYAVDPQYQGMGIGRELWRTTIDRLDGSINIGLSAVPEMLDKYKESGFVVEDSARMLIYENEPGQDQKLVISALKDINDLENRRMLILTEISTNDEIFKAIVDYDMSVHNYSRAKLLQYYLATKGAPLTIAIIEDVGKESNKAAVGARRSSCCEKQPPIDEDDALTSSIKESLSLSCNVVEDKSSTKRDDFIRVVGYGCIRKDNNFGSMIGPLYADADNICEVILKNLILLHKLHKPGCIYTTMPLSSNRGAHDIFDKIGLKKVDECARLFTKFVPIGSGSKVYSVHSPNFSLF